MVIITVFQITDGSRVDDPTVAALWPDRLSSAKPEIFVNIPCTWDSFPGHHHCCFMGCSQHRALESIYEWTLIRSIWLSNSPHTAANQLSWFYMRGSPGQPKPPWGGAAYTLDLLHMGWHWLMSLILSGECVHMRAAVCVHKGKNVQFQTQLYSQNSLIQKYTAKLYVSLLL